MDGEGLVGGRYVLGDVLGHGASAVVHRAQDAASGRAVAVKLFAASSSPVHRVQQRREIEALSKLEHPGLVRLLDGDISGSRPYLVTELVEGPTLTEVLQDGPMAPPAVTQLGAGLAAALAHVHANGFVHRDVKPSNVLLDHERPRLVDFGIARALEGTVVTATGASVGTAAYMAPEQVRGRDVTAAADVYALGLVLIEALTGKREYPGNAVESAIARLHRSPVVPDDLPRPLRRAIADMTRSEPERRPTAAVVADRLGGDGIGGIAPHVRRRLLVTAGAVVTGVALTGASGLLTIRPADAPAAVTLPGVAGDAPTALPASAVGPTPIVGVVGTAPTGPGPGVVGGGPAAVAGGAPGAGPGAGTNLTGGAPAVDGTPTAGGAPAVGGTGGSGGTSGGTSGGGSAGAPAAPDEADPDTGGDAGDGGTGTVDTGGGATADPDPVDTGTPAPADAGGNGNGNNGNGNNGNGNGNGNNGNGGGNGNGNNGNGNGNGGGNGSNGNGNGKNKDK